MITLTSSRSSTLEPLKKNRWIYQFASVPGNGAEAVSDLAFAAHTTTTPQISFTAVESQRINEKFFSAGKPTWNDISATFYDYISTNSAGAILYNWFNSIYNPITGQMFFKKQYSTASTLAQLDPPGGITRLWNMFYTWPMSVDWGSSFSYDDDTISEITISLKYDYAVKANDIDTTPA